MVLGYFPQDLDELRLSLCRGIAFDQALFAIGFVAHAVSLSAAFLILAMMLVGVATMTIVAPPAYADPPTPPNNDADFVQQLHAAGLTYQDPAKAVEVAKSLIEQVAGKSPPEAMALTVKTIAERRASDEAKEGLTAFLEKRRPAWAPERKA